MNNNKDCRVVQLTTFADDVDFNNTVVDHDDQEMETPGGISSQLLRNCASGCLRIQFL